MSINVNKIKPGDTLIIKKPVTSSDGVIYPEGTEVVFLGHISSTGNSIMVKIRKSKKGAFMIPLSFLRKEKNR